MSNNLVNIHALLSDPHYNFSYQPTGNRILVQVPSKEEVYQGTRIVIAENEAKREHDGRDIGVVVALGPKAYWNAVGCDVEYAENGQDYTAILDAHKRAENWGIKIGDLVEFRRYDGKIPRFAEYIPHFKDLRIISDTEVLAVIHYTKKEENKNA